MSSRLDVRLGVQEPQILHLPPGVVSHADAEEAIELAEGSGLLLDESQCFTLRAGMGVREDLKWAAFEVVDVEPRQSGKNETAMVAEAHGLFLAGDMLQLHTAHEASTVNEAFLRMEEFIGNNSELLAQVLRFRYGNGDHAVELKTGQRLLYKTRTGGAARGFAGAARLLYDEALYLLAKHVAASLSTLARGKTAAHNPQMWALSSGAFSTSTFLWAMRKRALLGNGGRFAYVEHTAEEIEIQPDGKVVTNRGKVDLDDRRLWAIANPAMNHPEHGISEEFIESEKRAQAADLDGWARERLGFFDPLAEDTILKLVKLPADKWKLTGISTERALHEFPGAAKTLAFEVTKDGEWSSISTGNGSIQRPYVETVEHRRGVGWLPAELVEYVHANGLGEGMVGCNGAGPAGAQVGAILLAFAEADPPIPAKVLKQFGAAEYKQACGGFYTDVVEGRLKRPAEGQGPLDLAAGDATERPLSGGWAWDVRDVTIPISPLGSATVARALLPVELPKRPAKAYSF